MALSFRFLRNNSVIKRTVFRTFSTQQPGEELWSWVPPREKSERHKDDYVIPIRKGYAT